MDAWTREMEARGHWTDYKRAKALKMSHSVISRLRSGENGPGQKFISRTCDLGIPYEKVFGPATKQCRKKASEKGDG